MRGPLFSCGLVGVLAASISVVAASVGPTPSASALPLGFVDSLVASVDRPTSVEALPDGRIVVLEKNTGRVRLIDGATDVVAPTPALQLDVCSSSEQGLLGFTTDPDIGLSGRVYVYYTRPAPSFPGGCVNRVSAFTLAGGTIDPGSEQVLIDNISSVNGNHNGGDLDVGNDGFLYVTTGDGGRDPRGDSGSGTRNDAARDLTLLNGKILRVDRFTGLPAPGNPIRGAGTARCGSRGNLPSTAATTCQEIFAWGLRNPFRFAFDPNTSATRFFINDVGQNTQEEVNEGRLGADYGWNVREGNCPSGEVPPCAGPPLGFTDPVTSYDRGRGTFITAGAFVPDGVWPEEFDGGYLFADGGSGLVWLRTADGDVDYGSTFLDQRAGITDMTFVIDSSGAALYYTLTGAGEVRKVTYVSPRPGRAPDARYEPLPVPVRAFDSREQEPPARLRGGQTRLIDVGAPGNATAALVNITLAGPAGGAFVSAWEPRTRRPASSNVNAVAGQFVANSAVVPVNEQGEILLFVRATSDVIVDVSGFFVAVNGPTRAGRLQGAEPFRLVDTREPAAADNLYSVIVRQGAASPGGPSDLTRINVPVVGRGDVPSSGLAAVAMIATGLDAPGGSSGFVRVAPGGVASETSSLNTAGRGDVRANLVVVPVGADGSVDVDLRNAEHVLLDVVGWFTDASASQDLAGLFVLTEPKRILDTRDRTPLGLLPPMAVLTVDPAGVPASASAVAQNIVMAPSSGSSFITAYPGPVRPEVSNLNSTGPGQFPAATTFTTLNGGVQRIFTLAQTELVVDVFGYFL